MFLPKVRVKTPAISKGARYWAQWAPPGIVPRYKVFRYQGTSLNFHFFKSVQGATIIWKRQEELGSFGFVPFLLNGGKA